MGEAREGITEEAPLDRAAAESRVASVERSVDRFAGFLQRPLVAGAVVALAMLSLLTYRPRADPDVFARVAVGRLVEMHGEVIDQDPFSFSPRTERWIDHEWLSGVVFYQVSQVGGELGLLALDLGMMLLTLGVLVRAAMEYAGERKVNLTWLLVVMVPAFGNWASVVRSGVFTIASLALMLLLLVRWRRRGPGWIWALPPVFLVWANFHGGFVAALGMLGMAALATTAFERRRSISLWLCLGAATLVTLLNPYGVDYWWYLLEAVTMERPGIREWNGLSVLAPHGFFAMMVTAVFLIGSLRSERKLPPEAWALAATTLAAAFSAQRMLNLFYPVLAVYGGPSAAAFGGMIRARAPGHAAALRRVAALGVPVAAAFLAVGVARNLAHVVEDGLSFEAFPVGAIEWLQTRGEGGRLLVHFNHGSFALWRLYPDYLISVDGRYEEVYPQSSVDLSFNALDPREPGHEEALRALDPDYILVPVASWAERFDPSWTTVYDDGRFAVLSRRSEHAGDGVVRPMWSPGF